MSQDSIKITIIVLSSALFGFITTYYEFYNLLISILPIIFFPLLANNYYNIHGWTKIAQFTTTGFCMGLIDGYCTRDIISYLNKEQNDSVPTFQIFLILLTIYHFFQFEMVNCFHHQSLKWDSFLIYHSPSYTIANTFMILEHVISKYYFNFSFKENHPLMFSALVIACSGEALRIIAFFTCKSNFTHLVSYRKSKSHELVTEGVYSVFRHPAYTGYFYFSVFGQIFLGNILSSILFAITLNKFFTDRIHDQEEALSRFFPNYLEYKKNTYIFIPFVKDPKLSLEEP